MTPGPQPTAPKRLTRAAIFASTALAAPACWTSSAPRHETPIEHTHDQGSGSSSEQHANDVPPPAPSTGTIVVKVIDSGTGNAVAHRWVRLIGGASPANQQAMTDANGVAVFSNVPPGKYQIEWHDGHPRHSPRVISVLVRPGETTHSSMSVYIAPYNPHQTPMPYGAPPARRRVV